MGLRGRGALAQVSLHPLARRQPPAPSPVARHQPAAPGGTDMSHPPRVPRAYAAVSRRRALGAGKKKQGLCRKEFVR